MLQSTKSNLIINNAVELGDNISVEDKGKGRHFTSRFIEAGLAHYQEFGDVLITKETLDKFIYSMVGCPVIIRHKDITSKNVDKERVGVVSKVWYNELDGWFWCEGIIWDKQAIDLIKNQGWSVSCTYDFESDFKKGTYHGKEYDMEFTGGEFLHLALVDNPRYERANIVVNSKDFNIDNAKDKDGNEGEWITVKGNHLFIKKGQSKEEAVKEFINKQQDKSSDKKDKEFKKADYNVGDDIKFDTNWRGVNPKISEGKIIGKEKKMGTKDDPNPDYQYKVKTNDGKTILVEKEAIQSDTKDKHGFKKDKDSGYYIKDLSDGTSVYVEKKESGQGEKEPFFLEATHFDKDGKTITKKQYHYDSMDGMFNKIDKDFVSKDKSGDSREKGNHLFIKKGQSKEEAVKEFINKQEDKKTETKTELIDDINGFKKEYPINTKFYENYFGKNVEHSIKEIKYDKIDGVKIVDENGKEHFPFANAITLTKEKNNLEKDKNIERNKSLLKTDLMHMLKDIDRSADYRFEDSTQKLQVNDFGLWEKNEDGELQPTKETKKRIEQIKDAFKKRFNLDLDSTWSEKKLYTFSIKHKANNNIGDTTMTVLNELKEFIQNVVNNKGDDMEAKNEKVDKRDIIRQIMAIAGKEEASEDVKTIAKLAEKLAYDSSEDSKADNKAKNEEDEEKEEKFEEEKEIANKKAKNEEKEEKEAENKCKNEEEEVEEKEEEKAENKCKNSMDEARKIVYGSSKVENTNYIPISKRIELGNNY